jgi:glycosyltransferase involved in cell wall biosynthesis
MNQTLQEIEIILIDDGSTDHSSAIIDEYAALDSRIVVVHKENLGYGSSMNLGLGIANGQYIGTVEADDYAVPEMFEEMYTAITREDAQIVKANYFRMKSAEGSKEEMYIIPPDAMELDNFDGEGALINPYMTPEIFWAKPSVWSAIYDKSFLDEHGIHFLETPGASFQDTGFQLKCFVAATRVYLMSKAYVHYRVDNAKSTVKTEEKAFFVRGEIESTKLFLRHFPHKSKKLLKVLTGVAFNTYSWNLSHLSQELEDIFLQSMRDDFANARDKDLLDKQYFRDNNWRNVKLLMFSPWLFNLYVNRFRTNENY